LFFIFFLLWCLFLHLAEHVLEGIEKSTSHSRAIPADSTRLSALVKRQTVNNLVGLIFRQDSAA
jgi:hypothetical protein